MKKTSGIIFAFYLLSYCSCSFVFSQSWSPVGTGVNGNVYAICSYNGALYAGGDFTSAGGSIANYIAKWDGSNWSPMGQGMNGWVYSVCVYNGRLYAGGDFNYAGGKQVRSIARWNGTSWDSVGSGMDNIVRTLYVYKGELYAGGDFITAGGVSALSVAKWNDTSWAAVGGGIPNITTAGVVTFSSYKNELYAGGYFDIANLNHIAKWNGIKWDTVGKGFNNMGVFALCQYKGELYAGGDFSVPGCSPSFLNKIAKWNGTCWDSVGHGCGGVVFALANYNNKLYCDGSFTGWGLGHIATWDSTHWSALDSSTDTSCCFFAFAVDILTNSLYVGGGFTMAGSIPANNIAKWTTPNGINELDFSSSFTIYPNPTNGKFTIRNDKLLNDGYELEIYNLLGETIYHSKINRFTDSTIDISDQPNGIYFLQVNSRNAIARQKIIIQK